MSRKTIANEGAGSSLPAGQTLQVRADNNEGSGSGSKCC
jgi:hypothetical protein